MSLLVEIARSVASEIRATLPSHEDEAAMFLSGMCWAFGIFIMCLLVVSYAALRLHGQAP
jgi:hypothetical protein